MKEVLRDVLPLHFIICTHMKESKITSEAQNFVEMKHFPA